MADYTDMLQRLFSINLHGGAKLGLENPSLINAELGFPDNRFSTVHIAGTNGKGSVSLKIATALQKSGYRVGLFTSPHLNTFRERITINGEPISEYDLNILLNLLFETIDKEHIPATFFEIATCLAFKYFATQAVDIAVIETGLGGRLDATNIIHPLLSIITSISLDHTEILGYTIEEIAKEKAGIIKHAVPVVIGPRVPFQVINEIANDLEAPLEQVKGNFTYFDGENSAIAKQALMTLSHNMHITSSAISEGIKATPTCRMQIFKHEMLTKWKGKPFPEALVIDVAHNPDGINHLFQALKINFPNRLFRVIAGLSKTKDIQTCLTILKNNAASIHLVEAANGRGVPSKQLFNHLSESGMDKKLLSHGRSIEETVDYAIEQAAEKHEVLVVCGTFFIMNAVLLALGLDVPSDPVDMNER